MHDRHTIEKKVQIFLPFSIAEEKLDNENLLF
jgi:hypothetical protein